MFGYDLSKASCFDIDQGYTHSAALSQHPSDSVPCREEDVWNANAELSVSVPVRESVHLLVCVVGTPQGLRHFYTSAFSDSGSIVSVGDPKKKYTRFEKIGQG